MDENLAGLQYVSESHRPIAFNTNFLDKGITCLSDISLDDHEMTNVSMDDKNASQREQDRSGVKEMTTAGYCQYRTRKTEDAFEKYENEG